MHSPVLRKFDQDGDGDFDFDDLRKIADRLIKKSGDVAIQEALDSPTPILSSDETEDGDEMKRQHRINGRVCVRCGQPKARPRKAKYDTGLCADCYNNPSEGERCVAISVTTKKQCSRRKRIGDYCGIHDRMNKNKE